MSVLENKRVLVTGGTGSLGKVLVRRLLSGELGAPARITVLSRDEAKQHEMRLHYHKRRAATDEVIYQTAADALHFRIGDVRDINDVTAALRESDVVFNAAALKQVPTCEYFPSQATDTNVGGASNIVKAIRNHQLPVDTVIGISTDKACKPVNVMGMTKAIQERIFIKANLDAPNTRFVCVRYGNVLSSRGSVIPLFHEQIRAGGPVTITTAEMTRFLLSLDQAVDTVFAALTGGERGDMYIPRVPAAGVTDLAAALIGDRPIETKVIGIRPGEKVHEILVSEEEVHRTVERGDYYVVRPILPELAQADGIEPALTKEYSSGDFLMTRDELDALLAKHRLHVDDRAEETDELLA